MTHKQVAAVVIPCADTDVLDYKPLTPASSVQNAQFERRFMLFCDVIRGSILLPVSSIDT